MDFDILVGSEKEKSNFLPHTISKIQVIQIIAEFGHFKLEM